MIYDIFISYSHQDREAVLAMAQHLSESGVTYFLDEKDVAWGVPIGAAVRSGLVNVAGVLLILSTSSVSSSWVPYEIGYASSRGRTVLPFLLDTSVRPPGYLGDIKCLSTITEATKYFKSAAWSKQLHKARNTSARTNHSLLELVEEVGLVDIEDRQLSGDRALPPEKYYRAATSEIAISGLTLFRTFDQHLHIIEELLKNNVRFLAMIMSPEAGDIPRLSILHRLDISSQIGGVFSRASQASLFDHPNFQLRTVSNTPPFTAVMSDGDLESISETPSDTNGKIRVQSGLKYGSQHSGLTLQFRKVPIGGGFNLFAKDFRRQWNEDAVKVSGA